MDYVVKYTLDGKVYQMPLDKEQYSRFIENIRSRGGKILSVEDDDDRWGDRER